MAEEHTELIHSCIRIPKLSQVGQPPGGSLGGAVSCQATEPSSCRLPHITIPALQRQAATLRYDCMSQVHQDQVPIRLNALYNRAEVAEVETTVLVLTLKKTRTPSDLHLLRKNH